MLFRYLSKAMNGIEAAALPISLILTCLLIDWFYFARSGRPPTPGKVVATA
jgi:hypothetical protein